MTLDLPRWAVAGLALALGLALLVALQPVLTPFLVSILLAYLGAPLVRALERSMPRVLAVSLVFFTLISLFVLLLLVLIPQLAAQLARLVSQWPQAVDWVQLNVLPLVQRWFGVELNFEFLKSALARNWAQTGEITVGVLGHALGSGAHLLGWLVNLFIIPVVTFYLLRDWRSLLEAVRELLPRTLEPKISTLAAELNDVLGAFLRGQFAVMLALGVMYSLGLWFAGLHDALLFGMGAGLVSFVPYLGLGLGMLSAGIAMFVQTQDLMSLLPVAATFFVAQAISDYLLTPRLIGDRVGLHPVMVIFAVMAGGQLFGFTGVLLALPAAAMLAVLARHAHESYIASEMYGAADEACDPGDSGEKRGEPGGDRPVESAGVAPPPPAPPDAER